MELSCRDPDLEPETGGLRPDLVYRDPDLEEDAGDAG
jgi:hypothetical protein